MRGFTHPASYFAGDGDPSLDKNGRSCGGGGARGNEEDLALFSVDEFSAEMVSAAYSEALPLKCRFSSSLGSSGSTPERSFPEYTVFLTWENALFPTLSNDQRVLWRTVRVLPPLFDVQDSLLEITLRSRVIEKLSVALDVCLFQHEKRPCPATNAVDEVSFPFGEYAVFASTCHDQQRSEPTLRRRHHILTYISALAFEWELSLPQNM